MISREVAPCRMTLHDDRVKYMKVINIMEKMQSFLI